MRSPAPPCPDTFHTLSPLPSSLPDKPVPHLVLYPTLSSPQNSLTPTHPLPRLACRWLCCCPASSINGM